MMFTGFAVATYDDQPSATRASSTSSSSSQQEVDSLPPPIIRNNDDSSYHVFSCSLCCEIPLDPVMAPVCQHVFCRSCIQQALESRSECPNDRQSLHFSQVTNIGGALRRIWEAVPVKCPKGECNWKGTLGSYTAHVRQCSTAADELKQEYERKFQQQRTEHERDIQQLAARKDVVIEGLRESGRVLARKIEELESKLQQSERSIPELDRTYRYHRGRIVELSQLVSFYLENKPGYIDSN